MPLDLPRAFDLVRSAAAAYGRPDLVARAEQLLGRSDDRALVAIIGEHKQGTSALVDAIVCDDVCSASPIRSTSVPTVVDLAGPRGAVAHRSDGTSVPVAVEDVPALATSTDGVDEIEVRLGVVDANEVVVVDLPGADGWNGPLGSRSVGWFPSASAVIVTHDASGPLTASSIELLALADQLAPAVALAITRCDLHPAWREVERGAVDRLAEAGLDRVAVFPVSARLAADPDPEAADRSGVDELFQWALDRCGAPAGVRAFRGLLAIVDQLAADLEGRRAAFAARDGSPRPSAPVGEVAPPVPALPWPTVLGDGIADCGAWLDRTWRDGLREQQRRAEVRCGTFDPADGWDDFAAWLRTEATGWAMTAAVDLRAEVARVADRVAAALHAEVADLLGTRDDDTESQVRALELELKLAPTPGIANRGLATLRASSGGITLGGVIAGVVGLNLAAPALVAVGAAMAVRTSREESKKQLEQRRQLARASAKRFLDDVGAVVLQHGREEIRSSQRTIRDRAILLAETASARQRTIEVAAGLSDDDRTQGELDLEAEIARVAKLRQRIADGAGSTP